MSAPQIPNLLTLRGGPRSRGRGRGRGTDHGGGPSTPARQRHDTHIQSTDTDAAVSRLSAVSLGYLDDPFASYFVSGQGTRRLPIINRGLWLLSQLFVSCRYLLTSGLHRNLHSDGCTRPAHYRLPFRTNSQFQREKTNKTNYLPRGRNRHTMVPIPCSEETPKGHLP
jgi:hypothetical protein